MNNLAHRPILLILAAVLVVAAVVVIGRKAVPDKWTGLDKAGHAKAGVIVGLVATFASSSSLLGALLVVTAALGKELWDTYHPGHSPSFKDAAVTIVAGVFGVFIAGLILSSNFIHWEV